VILALSAAALSLMSGTISALAAGRPGALFDAALMAFPLWLLLYALPMLIIAIITVLWRDSFGGVGIRLNWSSLQREAAKMAILDWFSLTRVRSLLHRVREPHGSA
jgi:ABC-type dipeptide/oligopeptide/nickel transport system permease subunit